MSKHGFKRWVGHASFLGVGAILAVVLAAGCGDSGFTEEDATPGDGPVVTGDGPPTLPDGGVPDAFRPDGIPVQCGNGTIDTGEKCDGANHNQATCQSLGFSSGTLKCKVDCTFDIAGCVGIQLKTYGQPCGGTLGECENGLICITANVAGLNEGYCTAECSQSKPCPGTPAGGDCVFKDTQSGKNYCGFLCSPTNTSCPPGLNCTWSEKYKVHECTTDAPAKCGNNTVELAEECDGTNLNNMTCQGFGYSSGTLKCTSSCAFDKSGCTGATTCANLPPRDCTGGTAYCSKLVEFLPRTDPGGNWVVTHPTNLSWIRQDTMMLIKYATASVKCMMPGSYPLATGDMSMSDGSTPKDAYGNLRHPSGTHDYGRDIDVAYYQSGSPDNKLRPVCPHTVNGQEAYHCTGAPNLLDVPRHTLFLAKLFESARLRVVGVDGQIGPLLKPYADTLYAQGKITKASKDAFASKMAFETTNTGGGWYLFHHHHSHVSTWTAAYPTPIQPEVEGAAREATSRLVFPLEGVMDLEHQIKPLDLDAFDRAARPDVVRPVEFVR